MSDFPTFGIVFLLQKKSINDTKYVRGITKGVVVLCDSV